MVEFKVYKHSNVFYPEVLVTVGIDADEESRRPSFSELRIACINRQNVFEGHPGLDMNCPTEAGIFIRNNIGKLADYLYRDALERAKEMIDQQLVYTKHSKHPLYQSYLASIVELEETDKLVLLRYWLREDRFEVINWLFENTKNKELRVFLDKIKGIEVTRNLSRIRS